ncbi:MAG: hypothetical protein ACXV5T_02215 [Halobacteriota archaeon]
MNILNNTSTQQEPEGQPQRQATVKQRAEVGLSTEVILLIVLGLFFFLLGLLLIWIYQGELPYSQDSTNGFFLVLVSLQIITMGKTPFGDVRQLWVVVIIGIGMAALGVLAIFIPGFLADFVRTLAGILLVIGGIAGLVRIFTSKDLAIALEQVGGIVQHLTMALGILYIFGIVVGLGALVPILALGPVWLIPILIFGASFFYVAWCVHKVNRLYRPEELQTPGT